MAVIGSRDLALYRFRLHSGGFLMWDGCIMGFLVVLWFLLAYGTVLDFSVFFFFFSLRLRSSL